MVAACCAEAIQSFELLSKFIAKEAVIPDALILVSVLGASAFHVQAALGPGTQAHSCVFRIGVQMDIKMMKNKRNATLNQHPSKFGSYNHVFTRNLKGPSIEEGTTFYY
ncbi:hypothetical protein NC652_023693 [Populus alba x Populus x berolinensis]|nr:hypothetical protein NC652_023693 [Populus alba x Populus x berolinensis]